LRKIIIAILIVLGLFTNLQAQIKNYIEPEKPLTRILIIFDASTSMMQRWDGGIKFVKAKELLNELLDSLETVQKTQKLEIAFRVYGHQSPDHLMDCFDTKLEVAFGKNTVGMIKDRLKTIQATGTTPIAYSLSKAEYDFPECSDCRNIVILITDGLEMCDGMPCEVSVALQKKGVVLKPYIIGVDIDIRVSDLLSCMGNYFDANNEKEFRRAINTIVGQVTNLTSVQVNLLDTNGKPIETNAVMSFHDNFSGDIRYTYMHTLNQTGQADTIYLDILSTYDLKVHTIPPVYLDSIKLEEGIHNIINLPAPQGYLFVDIEGVAPENSQIKCIVRQTALPETMYILDADKKQKLITGLYDLEILTMPRTYVDAVLIEQSKTTKINIKEPGDLIINFKNPAFASLLYERGDILTNLYDFTPDKTHYRFRLQPGYYRIIFREQKYSKSTNTGEFKFRINPGEFKVENL
jgi:Ca-activated chloride channel family protein